MEYSINDNTNFYYPKISTYNKSTSSEARRHLCVEINRVKGVFCKDYLVYMKLAMIREAMAEWLRHRSRKFLFRCIVLASVLR